MHYIRYDVLYQAVLERLQYWAKAVQQDEEKGIEQDTESRQCRAKYGEKEEKRQVH